MNLLAVIQKTNWRTTEVQFVDDDGTDAGAYIDLTAATGVLITTDPTGISYSTSITLGKFPRTGVVSDPTTEATQGWCFAVFEGINKPGIWSEQMQLILGTNTEPLNGPVTKYNVLKNLTPP